MRSTRPRRSSGSSPIPGRDEALTADRHPPAPAGSPRVPEMVVDGPKVMRLEGAVSAVLDELHHVDVRVWDEPRINQLVARILAEVGSSLPDPLLDELGRLVGPLVDGERHPSTVRVVLAQLEGWLAAVLAEAMAAVASGQVVPAAGPAMPPPPV